MIDENLKRQINSKSLYTCELHYTEDCLLRHESNRTTRKPRSLPTLNLPVKSFPTNQCNTERGTSSILKRELAQSNLKTVEKQDCYKSKTEFIQRIQKLKLNCNWTVKNCSNLCIIKDSLEHAVPQIEIKVDENLNYLIFVYNWLIPKTNVLYTKYNSNFKNVTLSTLINEIEKIKICTGLSYNTEHIISHHVPLKYVPGESSIKTLKFNRPEDFIVLSENEKCNVCMSFKRTTTLSILKKERN